MPHAGPGRPKNDQLINRLLLLSLALLKAPGYAQIQRDTVESLMNISDGEFDKLVTLLFEMDARQTTPLRLAAVDTDDNPFPEDAKPDRIVQTTGSSVDVAPRFTEAEWDAFARALSSVGVSRSDPLFRQLRAAYAPEGVPDAVPDEGDPCDPSPAIRTLMIVVDARSKDSSVSFDYVHKNAEPDAAPERRTIRPVRIVTDNGCTLVRGIDFKDGREKNFSLEGMSRAALATGEPPEAAMPDDERLITLSFDDELFYKAFVWPDNVLISEKGELPVRVRLPWYGSDWLPKRAAACNPHVTSDSEAFDARMRRILAEHARHA